MSTFGINNNVLIFYMALCVTIVIATTIALYKIGLITKKSEVIILDIVVIAALAACWALILFKV